MHGAADAALAKVSLTAASLDPMYFDRSSGPYMRNKAYVKINKKKQK